MYSKTINLTTRLLKILSKERRESLYKIIPLIGTLESGYSNILLNSSSEEKQVEIKIKENIKLSLDFINNIQKINGIDFISFS